MKQITISDGSYKLLLEKIHENTYGQGLTSLERTVIENTKDVESVELNNDNS